MERVAVYPGSFDPFTMGHLDIVSRGLRLFDRVVVLIGHNPAKKGTFSPEQRLALVERCLAGLPGASAELCTGLTAEHAARLGACAILRGIRGASDLESETTLASLNRRIAPEIETVFLSSSAAYRDVSSSAVRELAHYHVPLAGLVPACILEDVEKHLSL